MRALACIALLTLAGPARADQPQIAEALYDDAMRLMEQHRYADARDKLLESLRYLDGLGTRGKLAECYEKLGATATAWAAWREVEARARNNQETARERVAAAHVEALATRLSYLRIVAPRPPIAGARIDLDGVALGPAALAAPVPVDPGAHRLSAAAPGRVPWSTTVTVVDGATETVAVPRLPAAVADDGAATRRIAGITAVAVGGAALVAGGLVAWSAKSQWDDAFAGPTPHCDSRNVCDGAGQDATDSARAKANVATVLGIGGAALAVAGAVLWWTAHDEAPAPRLDAALVPRTGGFVVDVAGTF